MRPAVTHLVVGPRRHGVVRFGVDLTQALRDNGFDLHAVCTAGIADVPHAWTGGAHLQFTDRLFGGTPEEAADAVAVVAGAVRSGGGRVTATLHDLPQPSDGTNHRRRLAAYRSVAAAADGIVVSSEHERSLLLESGAPADRVGVVPLPIDVSFAPIPAAAVPPTVGIFGFVYPGKGHAEVIDALTGSDPGIEVLAIGAPSAGHDDLVEKLRARSARRGRRFTLTGHLPDDTVTDALRRVTVPVAPHRHISASGSLNSWLAAGRRPLAPSNRYTREIDVRNPGVLSLYPDTVEGLRESLARALAEPGHTWLTAGTVCTPTRDEAAARYAELLARWHR
ncbi:glycosyltransferase [Mycobacterium sp. NPDC050551]|uniref:glycosyltransferase n=1 Tax=Mycobacterium sp. NPDC050551 TaxID=3155407 RepID=UPI00343A2038